MFFNHTLSILSSPFNPASNVRTFDSFGEQTFQQNSQQTFEESFASTKSQQNSLRAIQLTNIENFVEIRPFIICLNYSSGHSSSQISVEILVEKSVGNFVEILVLSW